MVVLRKSLLTYGVTLVSSYSMHQLEASCCDQFTQLKCDFPKINSLLPYPFRNVSYVLSI